MCFMECILQIKYTELFYSSQPCSSSLWIQVKSLDHTGLHSVEEINECINSDLEIRLWLAANKLTLNLTKTEFLLIGSRQRLSNLPENPSIKINQIPVEQVSTTKSLGVYIDQNLNWEFQIKEISKKIASGVSAIKRIRDFVPGYL